MTSRRGSSSSRPPAAEAKEVVLSRLAEGMKVRQAMDIVGRSVETYRGWRRDDPLFKERTAAIREDLKRGDRSPAVVPDFPEFSEKYLRMPLPECHLRIWDFLCGLEPRSWHESFDLQWSAEDPTSRQIVNIPPDHGKAEPLDNLIPTPDGFRRMGDLGVGDKVFGPDGKARAVAGVTPVTEQECFELTFADGSRRTVAESHLWTVYDREYRTKTERGKWVTKTTSQLASHRGARPRYATPMAIAPEFPTADLPIGPYTLGAWLGDGDSGGGGVTTHLDDEQVLDEIRAEGYLAHRTGDRFRARVDGLTKALRLAGVQRNKHVPDAYLTAGPAQREAVLQGLMDTDGTVNPEGQCTFVSTTRALADGVVELVRSLGGKAFLSEYRTKLNGRDCGPGWKVSFYPHGFSAFRLARKAARQRAREETRATRHMIKSVKPVGLREVRCITIDDPAGLYVSGREYVVTHNSTTWSMNWVTWLIHKNPSVRVIIVSKTQSQAKKFLLGVKQRLTNPVYHQLQTAFAPPGGWKDETLPWREDMVYVRGRNPEEKDPTVHAIGIRGQIYGSRADVVILDDAVDLGNYQDFENQADWLAHEVDSRLVPAEGDGGDAGRMVMVGTRVGSMDLYKHLKDSRPLADDEPTYSYFKQPALLEGLSTPDHTKWRVLWPERQTAKHIRKRRGAFTNPRHFQLVFQQDDVPEDSTFNAVAVKTSVNGQRYPGPMVAGASGHRRRGMDQLYTIGSWDPASSAGVNAMIALGLDEETQKRWVLDAWNKRGALPRDSEQKLKEFTETYNIREWRIEKNAVQEYITQLDWLKDYLASRGTRLSPHSTYKNKWDADQGVETMSALFDSCGDYIGGVFHPKPKGHGLIELPHQGKNPAIQELVNQLCFWEPENKRMVQDLVMALWFAELGARDRLFRGQGGQTHLESRFTPRGALGRRKVVSLDEYRQELAGVA